MSCKLKVLFNHYECSSPVGLSVDIGAILFLGSVHHEKNALCENGISPSQVTDLED